MMDPQLAQHVASVAPKLNPVLANGLATLHMPYAEAIYLVSIPHHSKDLSGGSGIQG